MPYVDSFPTTVAVSRNDTARSVVVGSPTIVLIDDNPTSGVQVFGMDAAAASMPSLAALGYDASTLRDVAIVFTVRASVDPNVSANASPIATAAFRAAGNALSNSAGVTMVGGSQLGDYTAFATIDVDNARPILQGAFQVELKCEGLKQAFGSPLPYPVDEYLFFSTMRMTFDADPLGTDPSLPSITGRRSDRTRVFF